MLPWLVMMTLIPTADPEIAGKRYVIIHADDAGMSHSVNRGTIEAMDQGVVSSASIMVPCPWFPEFARYARENPDKDYGIHLTLNSEWEWYRWRPVSDPSTVPSLVDEQGYLWDNVTLVAENVKVEDAERELRAQIERAKAFGVPLTHLDTHMGSAFSRPDLARLYVKLSLEYNLPVLVVRPTEHNGIDKEFPEAARLVEPLAAAGMPILDDVFQYYERGSYEDRKAKYVQVLRGLKPGVTEIIIHCGFDDAELRAITSSSGLRDSDRRIFLDPEVRDVLRQENIELLTWRQFRELAR